MKNSSSGLSQEFKRFTDNGGSLLIFPAAEIDALSYQQLSQQLNCCAYEEKETTDTRLEQLNIQHPLYADVFEKLPENIDLPQVFNYYNFSKKQQTRKEYILKMLNGKDFLIQTANGKGIIYQCAVPLDISWSNFPKHAIFVPTLFNIALYSQNTNKLFYTIGKDEAIVLKNIITDGENVVKLRGEKNDAEVIPEHKNFDGHLNLLFYNQIKKAGNYTLFSDKASITGISYNYDRNE